MDNVKNKGELYMKTLIAYATKHGAAEGIGKRLSEKLNSEVDLINLKEIRNIGLAEYDKVIIGSSVYMGKIRKEASRFCNENSSKLKEKKTGIYICCMREGKEAEQELKDNFPDGLIDSAVALSVFGGEFNFDKMNFMEKMIVKKVAGIEETQSNISEESIDNFADLINNA